MFNLYGVFYHLTIVLNRYGGYGGYEYYKIINEDSIQYIEVLDNLDIFN